MKFSLRWTLILGVALANALVFGLGVAWMSSRVEQESDKLFAGYESMVSATLAANMTPEGQIWSAGLLAWSGWPAYQDVLLVHLPELKDPSRAGDVGLMLNPNGTWGRGIDFPEDQIIDAVRTASREGRSVSVAGGLASILRTPDGEPWGGAWVVSELPVGDTSWLRWMLPWFGLSVLLLTALTYVVTDRLLLGPLRRLSLASDRVARGDFTVRVPEEGRRDELGRLERTFNSMTAEVEGFGSRLKREVDEATAAVRRAEAAATTQKRLAATGELAAGIAHEINNPLGGMLNAVEVLERGEQTPEKRRQYLELVRHGLERIQRIARGVLLLAPRSPRTGPVDLAATLEASLGLVRHRLESQGVEVWVGVGIEGSGGEGEPWPYGPGALQDERLEWPPFEGQGDELGQGWLNLWVNSLDALKAAQPGGGGRMGLRVERTGAKLRLLFWDSGPGVPADVLPRVADPFFSTKEVGEGTGLGLSFLHQVIAAHGGTVSLESEPGKGFRVLVELPLGVAEA